MGHETEAERLMAEEENVLSPMRDLEVYLWLVGCTWVHFEGEGWDEQCLENVPDQMMAIQNSDEEGASSPIWQGGGTEQ